MASQAQIDANKRNSKRSTGPKTTEGKNRVRSNALKHGGYAVTIVPFSLKGDDSRLEQKTRQWEREVQPRDAREHELVRLGARLTQGAGTRRDARDVHARRPGRAQVRELGRRLMYIAAPEELKAGGKLPWTDDPGRFLGELEATAEGCRWLLERWGEYRNLLDHKIFWKLPQLLRFIRLQGKDVVEALYDPDLNTIFLAWDVLQPKFAEQQWGYFQAVRLKGDAAMNDRLDWYEIAKRPADKDAAWAVLDGIVKQQIERLKMVLTVREAAAATGDPGWVDRAALECGPAFERLRRGQSARHRELMRTLDELRKLQKEECPIENEEEEAEEVAGEACPATENAPNKANFDSKEAPELQRLTSVAADLEEPEQTQSGGDVAGGPTAAVRGDAGDGADRLKQATSPSPEPEKRAEQSQSGVEARCWIARG